MCAFISLTDGETFLVIFILYSSENYKKAYLGVWPWSSQPRCSGLCTTSPATRDGSENQRVCFLILSRAPWSSHCGRLPWPWLAWCCRSRSLRVRGGSALEVEMFYKCKNWDPKNQAAWFRNVWKGFKLNIARFERSGYTRNTILIVEWEARFKIVKKIPIFLLIGAVELSYQRNI